ncbi:MAG: sigma-70 family RNA polymerase sigma factor [Ruminococcaceae bacterium]|nr:sigma-70 family RNA polymerase sigma factor [Oscillospiraceae bacterium]
MFDTTFAVIENEKQRSELAEFYSEHKSRLYAIALSKLHNKEEAEDAVQEVFSQIADKPEKFFEVPPDYRLAYADIMLKNIAVDMFKRNNKVHVEELSEDIEDGVSPEDSLFDGIGHSEMIEFINNLPTMRRNVLMLRCFFDIPITEIAQRLKIAPATASKHLTLARKAVRDFIAERKNRL